jgi:predicted esterase
MRTLINSATKRLALTALTLPVLFTACASSGGTGDSGAGASGGGITGTGAGASGGGITGTGAGASGGSTGSFGTGGSGDTTASTSSGSGGSGGSTPASSSSSSSSTSSSTSGTGGGTVNAVCHPIVNGMSSVTVNGTTRTFSVQLPADTSHMALLFLWHGWMQNPTDFANTIVYDVPSGNWVPFDPNAFPMPLMIVTPVDTKLIPPWGLDWDIVSGAKDFPYFEAMLDCIHQQFNIDDTRVYSFGFSAGAVFTDLLSAKYPHLFAATISESGAWFNDSAEWSDVLVPIIQWQWPAFAVADHGNVLLTHGGPNDFATVISLEDANSKALPFLHTNGRTVMECAHTFGHTLDPDLTQGMYYEYMWDHKLGGPPLSAMIPDFPTPAKPVGATSCTLHPYP